MTLIDGVFLFSLIVIWTMLLYHAVLSFSGYKYSVHAEREKWHFDSTTAENLPYVSILIPAHNEELVIEKTLIAIGRLEYPKHLLEIICLNDNSTDRTGEVARKAARSIGPYVEVVDVPEDRGKKGKSAVLNYGLEVAQGEVIAVYDADNTPEKNALLYLVRNLIEDRARLGAVIGKFRTRNKDRNLLTRFINLETIFFQWTTQAGRWKLYKLATIPGTNFVIWKDLIQSLGGWDERALTEDTELSIRIYLRKKAIKMVPYAITWEEEPSLWRVWFKQRTRWARGNIYVLKKYFFPLLFEGQWKLFFDMLYLFMIYFLFLTSLTASLCIFILGISGLSRINLQGPFNALWALSTLLFVVELSITLTAEPGEDHLKNIFLGFLMYFSYTQLWLLVMFNALFHPLIKIFKKEETFWHKTERTG